MTKDDLEGILGAKMICPATRSEVFEIGSTELFFGLGRAARGRLHNTFLASRPKIFYCVATVGE